jgi:replicative DNA helicase
MTGPEAIEAIRPVGSLQIENGKLLVGVPLADAYDIPDPERWVARLKRKAVERKAWQLAERMRLSVESGVEDTAEELARFRDELRSMEADLGTAATPSTLADAVAGIGIDNLLAAPRGLIGSAWPRLTERINDGMRPGELWIVAARPSVGKTTFALQWALEAGKAGWRVLFVSLEMPVRIFSSERYRRRAAFTTAR